MKPSSSVAVVGMSGLFPEAEDLQAFYKNLSMGLDSIRPISEERLQSSTLYPFYNYQEIGHLSRVDHFDHKFFNLSKKEAETMDPCQRILLELSVKALLDSGNSLSSFRGSQTSIYLGGGVDSKYARQIQEYDPSMLTGNLNAMSAGRISYQLDLRGASMMIGTACSSSLVAVHHGCQDVLHEEATYALAGGFHVLYNFARKEEVNKLGTESLDGRSKAFDQRADGTGGGEGGGLVLLKRLDKALKDGDNIHAVIKGTSINQDGGTSNGQTAPSPSAQRQVIEKAWEKSAQAPGQLGYIEAHGTGTKLGDPIEIQGLSEAFKDRGATSHRCAISSVKTNIGHLDNAAGIAGLLKCILSVKHGVHFPSLHYQVPNPFIDFSESPVYVNTTLTKWEGPRHAGVSSFGITGTNSHAVVSEAPEEKKPTSLPLLLLKVSGRSASALQRQAKQITIHLREASTDPARSLYTLNTGRDDFKYRVAIQGDSLSGLIENCEALRETTPVALPEKGKSLIYLLPGEELSKDTLETLQNDPLFSKHYESYLSQFSTPLGAASKTVLAQISYYDMLFSQGVQHYTLIASGIGRVTRSLITKEQTLQEAISSIESDASAYTTPFDPSKLTAVLSQLSENEDHVYAVLGTPSSDLYTFLSKGQNDLSEVLSLFQGHTSNLCALYNAGVLLDWSSLYQGETLQKASVPTYSFEKTRCWHREPVENLNTLLDDWFYEMKWEATPLPSQTEVPTRHWLVVTGAQPLSDTLIEKLQASGHTTTQVTLGTAYSQQSADSYTINPTAKSSYDQLFESLKHEGSLPEGVIHLGGTTDNSSLEATLSRGLYSHFMLVQMLDAKLEKSTFDYYFVSSEGYQVSTSDFHPLKAGSQGFLRGMEREYPQVTAKLIDIDTNTTSDSLYAELFSNPDYKIVSHRSGKRYTQTLTRVSESKLHEQGAIHLASGNHYMITGGLSGIGYAISKWLATHYDCQLTLVGRTALLSSEDHAQRLSHLQAGQATVTYYACDLTDDSSVSQLAASLSSPVDGLIHAAAVPGSKRIKHNNLENFRTTVESRIKSIYHLQEHLPSIGFSILFSSLSGILPANDRESDYASSCTLINEYGKWLNAQGHPTKVINWCAWQDTGMLYRLFEDKTQLTRATKALFVTTSLGLRIFNYLLHSGINQAMVMSFPQLLGGKEVEQLKQQHYFSTSALLGEQAVPAQTTTPSPQAVAPAPEQSLFSASEPLSATEKTLGKIWAEVLKVDTLDKSDDFFEIGGNSINGFQVVRRIEDTFGITIEVEDLFEFLSLEELADHIDSLIAENRKEGNTVLSGLPVYEEQEHYAVSHAQKRLWVLDQLEGNSSSYNMPALFEISDELDISLLNKVFQVLVTRHDSLRTLFIMTGDGPRQKVVAPESTPFKIDYRDFREVQHQDTEVQRYLSNLSTRSFDLQHTPLLRVHLLHVESDRYLLFINMHHIISDGWSIQVFFKEMSTLYFNYLADKGNPLAPLTYQYKDYSIFQNELLTSDELKDHKTYWLDQFSEEVPPLNFPRDHHPSPDNQQFGKRQDITFGEGLYKTIKQIAREHHCTHFMVMLSLLKALLFKYTNQNDIVIGTPLAERSHPDLEDQIGFYLDNLALRTQFQGSDTFKDLLEKVKKTTLGAFNHKHYPFDRLVDDLGLARETNKFPLFDIGLTWDTSVKSTQKGEHKAKIQGKDLEQRKVKTDIWFYGVELADTINLSIEYDASLYSDQRIKSLLLHFKHLLESITTLPDQPLQDIDILSSEERLMLLKAFNSPRELEGLSSFNLIDHFHQQVEATPLAEALVYEDTHLSYEALNHHANALANHLIEDYALKPGTFIGIYGHRSERLIISILAVLKAGGTYVPIDVNAPTERVGYILSDANVTLLLTDSDHMFNLPESYEGGVVATDIIQTDLPATPVNIAADSSVPPYVIYTSGSTGVPKGVLVHQRGVVNMTQDLISRFDIEASDAVLLFYPISFDASVHHIFMALLRGASLVVLPEALIQDTHKLLDYAQSKGTTVAGFTPSYLSLLPVDRLKFLRAVITGGEAAPFEQTLHYSKHFTYYNAYGPTECTVCSTVQKVDPSDKQRGVIPIGSPIQNTEIFLMNEGGLVPVGVPGEICIGGDGVALGYVNNPELTHERFVDNPFKAGEKMYRTGDLGSWHTDGVIEYMGRVDRQVKIRGYRIELGEIEEVVKSLAAVTSCVTTVFEEKGKGESLVAYVVSTDNIDLLKSQVSQRLPDYMVPSYFIQIDSIPLTANGKVNYRKLPQPQVGSDDGVSEEPRNANEEQLLKLWCKILATEKLSISDDFFEVGGNSLKAIELVAEINNIWKNDLQLKDLFAQPTIAEQAVLVERPSTSSFYDSLVRIEEQEHYPVSYAQKGVFKLTLYEKQAVPYNMTKYFKLNNVDVPVLERAVNSFYERHASLRSTFHKINEEARQKVIPINEFNARLIHEDFTQESNAMKKATKLMDERVNEIFKKSEGPLCKFFLFHLPQDRFILLVLIDHIISDGWSINNITNELTDLYRAYAKGEESPCEPLQIQYYDYAAWQMNYLDGEEFEQCKKYWDSKLLGRDSLIDFHNYVDGARKVDRTRSYRQSMMEAMPKHFKPMTEKEMEGVLGYVSGVKPYEGKAYRFIISEKLKNEIAAVAKRNKVSVFSVILTSVNLLIYELTQIDEIVSVVPVSNRDQDKLTDQVGWLINKTLVISKLDPKNTVQECFGQVSENMLEAIDYSTYPFSKLLADYDVSLEAISPVMVHYMGYDMNVTEEITDFESCHLDFSLPSFDFNFTFYEKANGIETVLEYRSDVFQKEAIEVMMSNYHKLLERITKNPEIVLEKIINLDNQKS